MREADVREQQANEAPPRRARRGGGEEEVRGGSTAPATRRAAMPRAAACRRRAKRERAWEGERSMEEGIVDLYERSCLFWGWTLTCSLVCVDGVCRQIQWAGNARGRWFSSVRC
eukprot:68350-Chlamydomonas_euryale.AAC.1